MLLVLVVVVVLWASFRSFHGTSTKGTYLDGVPLTGSLYLTLRDPSSSNLKLNVYTFNLSTQKLAPLFINDKLNITPDISPDGTQVAFMSRWSTELAYQLFVVNTASMNVEQITQDANNFKQDPIWSRDGTRVAYVVQGTGKNLNSDLPNSWFVFVADIAQHTQQVVSAGVDPFFSPDGKTLFVLQNDGIHAVDLSKLHTSTKPGQSQLSTSTLVVPTITGTTTPASQTMKIALSHDATHLVWTAPRHGLVRVFKITSWAPLALVAEKDLPANTYYAVFSPDSQYLALEEVDLEDASTKPTNARVVVYHLGDYNSTSVTSLSAYSAPYIRLTAWQ